MTRRSNRTRGTRPDNMGAALKARSRASFPRGGQGGYSSGNPSAAIRYFFDGLSMYATHSSWSTLGNFAVYGAIGFQADGAQDDVVVSVPPVVEFGRVGINYHEGDIWNVKYDDTSPIQNTNTKATSIGTVGPFVMDAGSVAFDYIDAGDGDIITDYLSVAIGLYVLSANATNLIVDGTAYAGETINIGQHYAISFDTTGGTLTTIVSGSGMANLEINT
jgi:hypothetical protein